MTGLFTATILNGDSKEVNSQASSITVRTLIGYLVTVTIPKHLRPRHIKEDSKK